MAIPFLIRVNLVMPAKLYLSLKRYAKKTDQSISRVIRSAVAYYVGAQK